MEHTVKLRLNRAPGDSQVELDGIDISSSLQGVTIIRAAVDAITTIRLEVLPTEIDAILENPDILRDMTIQECKERLESFGYDVRKRDIFNAGMA